MNSLKSFTEVLNFEVSWLDANLFWVFLSTLIYLTLIGLFLNAIRMSIQFEKKNSFERSKTYGNFFKGVLFIGLITAMVIFSFSIYVRF